MSVELVTGYSGVGGDGQPNRHVSSADDGARQAGTVGTGMYVLGTGAKMSATMEDANTLVVADGDAMINGRHVRIPDTLSFTIPTGVQGQKVANLAVLRYSKAADSVESVTPVVLTGEPDPDSPADPALSEGSVLDGDSPVDMPLYRVVTDGINAGDPEAMFDVMLSMAELRDSVSQKVVSVTREDSHFNINARRVGGTVVMSIYGSGSPIWSQTEVWGRRIATVPDGSRPAQVVYACVLVGDSGWNRLVPGQVRVEASGAVMVDCKGFAPNIIVGELVYAVG